MLTVDLTKLAISFLVSFLLIFGVIIFLLLKEVKHQKSMRERSERHSLTLEKDVEECSKELMKYKSLDKDEFESHDDYREHLVEIEKQKKAELMEIKMEQEKIKDFEAIAAFTGKIEGEE